MSIRNVSISFCAVFRFVRCFVLCSVSFRNAEKIALTRHIVVKPTPVLEHKEVQRRWKATNTEDIRTIDKRCYLKKMAIKMGKPGYIVDKWLEEWMETGEVTYK